MSDYWKDKCEKLKAKSTRDLNMLLIAFSPYERHPTFGNYYHHIKAELAERVGRKHTK